MTEISVENVCKEYVIGEPVLRGVTFHISTGEHVGLLGENGSGKTTLLKIITGEVESDAGYVRVANGRKMGVITQIPVYPAGYSVEDVLDTAFSDFLRIHDGIRSYEQKIAENPTDKILLSQYDLEVAKLAAFNRLNPEIEKNKICNGLSISEDMRGKLFSVLSGGEKTRINLARIILENPEILLLDEPTNHLDIKAAQWLENYLSSYKGTILVVSHDRYFLDQTVHRIIELSGGKAEFYKGNYSDYCIERQNRYLEKLKNSEAAEKKVQQLKTAADNLHLWAFKGNDKMHKRAASIEKRIDRIEATIEKPHEEKRLKSRFAEEEFKGDRVLLLKNLSKKFGDKTVLDGITAEMRNGERVALLGDNGAGKSTLIKIIMKEENADQGIVQIGPSVKIGYLPQQSLFRCKDWNLLEETMASLHCSSQTARNRLAAFGFQDENVFKKIYDLSGGEQMKLKLCIIMSQQINLLILDEPTNHLDIISREWIENALSEYMGNMFFVSHDRYFIKKFANRIWTLQNGKIEVFTGNYTQYLQQMEKKDEVGKQATGDVREIKKQIEVAHLEHTGGTKMLEKKQRSLEKEIGEAERELRELDEQIQIAGSDYKKIQELSKDHQERNAALQNLYQQWENIASRIEEQKTKIKDDD